MAATPATDVIPAASDRPPHRRRHQRPEGGPDRPAPSARPDRPQEFRRNEQGGRPPRGGRPDRDKRNRGDSPDRDPGLRAQYIKGRNDVRRDRAPDPDSPFAKLAALKAQLEADSKERR